MCVDHVCVRGFSGCFLFVVGWVRRATRRLTAGAMLVLCWLLAWCTFLHYNGLRRQSERKRAAGRHAQAGKTKEGRKGPRGSDRYKEEDWSFLFLSFGRVGRVIRSCMKPRVHVEPCFLNPHPTLRDVVIPAPRSMCFLSLSLDLVCIRCGRSRRKCAQLVVLLIGCRARAAVHALGII